MPRIPNQSKHPHMCLTSQTNYYLSLSPSVSVCLSVQLVPFTVTRAYESLVQMSDWLFLARDEGEGRESVTLWGEDTEPEPCKSDSWAEGCVPVRYTSVSSHTPLLQVTIHTCINTHMYLTSMLAPSHA
jgi:hypothetical protein